MFSKLCTLKVHGIWFLQLMTSIGGLAGHKWLLSIIHKTDTLNFKLHYRLYFSELSKYTYIYGSLPTVSLLTFRTIVYGIINVLLTSVQGCPRLAFKNHVIGQSNMEYLYWYVLLSFFLIV